MRPCGKRSTRLTSSERCSSAKAATTCPERTFLDNTLQTTYGLHPDALDEFVELFQKSCCTAKIGKGLPTDAATPINGQGAAVISAGKPNAKAKAKAGNRPVCFIIMPFSEQHDDHEVGFFTEPCSISSTPRWRQQASSREPRSRRAQTSFRQPS